MAQEVFAPRADLVGEDLFIETRATLAATTAMWRVLELSRLGQWVPWVVVAGQPGAGKTTLMERFVLGAQRSIACDLLRERVERLEPDPDRRDASLRERREWAERMARELGTADCPAHCMPAGWISDNVVNSIFFTAEREKPVARIEMPPKPDRDPTWPNDAIWHSPGNMNHHPTRRTSMILIDGADRLLSRSQAQRRASLDALEHFIRHVVEHPVVPVLIGTPELADTLSAYRATHVVRVDAMALDDEFGTVVGMLFGTRDATEVATLHRQSAGLIGRLVHIARMRGLTPPFSVPDVEIRRLPAPAAD